ncbi:unnamed protein product [Candidula unifasciata]|uniref:Uncharacterized protein n=1 Tax=Candidula unifasciata TaxID=100452 RepID=A0A8S3ZN14_9EUPU|nr:unnamed protein product [Candidula unifasciata]
MTSAVWILVCSVSVAVLLSPAAAVCPYNVTSCTCTGRSLVCRNLDGLPTLVSDNKDGNITDLTFISCTCTGRSLVCRNLDGLPTLVSDNKDGNITDLTFISGKLNISSNSLPTNLQNLTFSDVSITSISPDAFNSSATTLKSFSMSKVKYPELPDALLQVTSLTQINLSDMNITNWKPQILQTLGKTLRSVVFQNVSLTSWPEWLQDFTLVNSVDLSRNNLEAISVDAFSKVKNLTSLYLRSTDFYNETNVNIALHEVINTLQILDISTNGFAFIPEVISTMTKLAKLNLSDNLIQEISGNRIPLQLRELDLYRNINLQLIKDNSFPNSSSLEVLNLGATRIYNISYLAFEPLEHLRELYLNFTDLFGIPLALTKLNNLQVLKMEGIHSLVCPCPRDDRLVKWYQSYKTLQLTGNCIHDKFTIQRYLANSTTQSPCSGNSRAAVNVSFYLFVTLLMSIFLL